MIGDVLLECELSRASADARRLREPRRPDATSTRAPSRSAASSPASATTASRGFEGCRLGRAIGTYLHGPLLPRNPWLADWLLAQALAHRRGGEPPRARAARAPSGARSADAARSDAGTSGHASRPGGPLRGAPPPADVRAPRLSLAAPRARRGRRAGSPGRQRCEEALDRRMEDDRRRARRARRAGARGRRRPATSTSSSERPPRSPAKMMWTTCLSGASSCTGAIESTIATGPSTGTSSSMPELLASSRCSASIRLSPASTPPPGQQPVLLARLLVAAEQDAARASAGAPRRGSAARAISARDGAEAAHAALATPAARRPRRSSTARHRQDDELRDPHARLDDERLSRVGVQER